MPFGFAGAVVGAGLLSAAGSAYAGSEQAGAAEHAADIQANEFNTVTAQEQPFLQSGYLAQGGLNYLLGLNPSTPAGAPTGGASPGAAPYSPVAGLPAGFLIQPFTPTEQQLEAYPGYEFQLKQGDLATKSASSAGVGALSGAALKSLSSFNQGLAASNYNDYFNQYLRQQDSILNRLSSIAGLGQNAAANLGNTGAQLATGQAQATAAAGGAIAGGIVGGTNAAANTLSTLGLYGYLNQGNPYSNPYSGGALSSGVTDSAGSGFATAAGA